MFGYSIGFDRPQYLVLLALIPLMWWLGFRSLAGLGRWRRGMTLALRSLVVLGIVLALADVQTRRKHDQITVVYLLDQSLSIPAEMRQAMLDYVARSVRSSQERRLDDRYAVIAFGRDAAVEAPPIAATLAVPPRLESVIDPEFSDLAAAVERAQSLFPHDAARRIVLVTDGNENRGSVYREARAAADSGVSIDVVPVRLTPRVETAVEKVDLPSGIRRGQPFEVRVVVSNDSPRGQTVPGVLSLIRKSGEREEIVAQEPVEIPPGKHARTIREQIELADFYTYEARFVPDDPAADAVLQNNVASAFTFIRGKGNILVIENYDTPGQYDRFVDCLRREGLTVTVSRTDQLFSSLAELQRFDAVVLANVSQSDASDGDTGASFSDAQIDMLVRNTREMGCGLIMLGGPESFGAGGWANTKLEEAMPVDFQLKAAEVRMVGALAIVLDRSGSMEGEKLVMSKAAAIAAIRSLGRRDFISVTAFDAAPLPVVPLRRVGDYRSGANRVDSIGSAGGTDVYVGMRTGFADLRKAQAGVKHMIVLTDGQTPDAKFDELVAEMRRAGITVTAVAVGGDANIPLLQRIAQRGGGKFYAVRNPRNLPQIFLTEVRRVARPLVYEPPSPLPLQRVTDHEILNGADSLPPISGLVLTTVKENPLVEVVLRSPQPATAKNATVLATWTYGAGKAAVWTTDAGSRWTKAWPQWVGYDKFFSQLVRWAMRPVGEAGNFHVATNVQDGVTQVVVTALDANDEFLNDQVLHAAAIAPDLTPIDVRLEQTAPGRYVGEFPSADAGAYMIAVTGGAGGGTIRTGVNVGYSPEYQDRQTNLSLLESLARLRAGDGPAGRFADAGLEASDQAAGESSPFRRDLPAVRSNQSVWPWLVVAASCVFWGDVFVRRVHVNLAWIGPAMGTWRDRILRRERAIAPVETMRRLRSRKSEVGDQIASRRAVATRLEPDVRQATPQPLASTSPQPPSSPTGSAPAAAPADAKPTDAPGASFTERLLKAKKDVRRSNKDRDKRNR